MIEQGEFMRAFLGSFIGALRWHQLDALWAALQRRADAGWYIYTVGAVPPQQVASAEQLARFVRDTDALLRREHREDYCGIVYADDFEQPSFIKIYHPRRLGVVCGPSAGVTLPGWVLSLSPPVALDMPPPEPSGRGWRRWLGLPAVLATAARPER